MTIAKIGAPVHTQARRVEKIFIHERFEPATLANDIALVKLDVCSTFQKKKTVLSSNL
jgi:hypothetical protein